MSVHQQLVSEGTGDERRGYVLHSGDDGSDPASVNVDVWDDRYNLEWRTDADLATLYSVLENIEALSADAPVTGYASGQDLGLKKIESEYGELAQHKLFPEFFGNIHINGDGFKLIWEDTKRLNTVELTRYRDGEDIFEDVYRDTALEGGPHPERISDEIDQILDW
jgi:hypothetical protein